jgi:ABC-2 type transport system permease protein
MTMMSAIVARINNPLIPRAIFGVLNTLLYFPSGAIYPVEALPWWLRIITRFDPFTYAIDGFRGLLLRGTSIGALFGDIACLAVFGALMLTINTVLFKRTL